MTAANPKVRKLAAAPRNGASTVIVILLGLSAAVACSNPAWGKTRANTPPDAQAIKTEVSRIAIGKDVKVKLTSGRTLRGHLARIGENSFSVRTGRHGAERQIRYDQATQVKDPGPIGWMLLGAAVVVIVIVIVH